ncbi:MAG: hypothetical protein PHQ32_06405 [Firmicutes bacterium]|nr:hypothetical protein [Bacillota bacterium]
MRKYILLFVLTIFLFWLDWLLAGIAWNNFYGILETITFFANQLIFITIIITGILLIIQILKKLKGTDGIYDVKRFFGVILSVLIVIFVMYTHFQTFNTTINSNSQVGGFGPINSKNIINGDYYFYLYHPKHYGENIRFKTDKKSYEKIIVDEKVLYTYEYKTDFFDNSRGILQSFDYDHYIDNRTKIID